MADLEQNVLILVLLELTLLRGGEVTVDLSDY